MNNSKVKVAVRVRPLNQREVDLNSENVVDVNGNQITLLPPSTYRERGRKEPQTFTYDKCFWTEDRQDPGQEEVFVHIGEEVLENIWLGYNVCVFAYGQTGSGKTFSMMGTDDQPGIVPRICSALYSRKLSDSEQTIKIEASYYEIYNEEVRDLLRSKRNSDKLRVREDRRLGPYVEGLYCHSVQSNGEVKLLLEQGNKLRAIAETKMNEQSSRSHAILDLTVTQTCHDQKSGASRELVSKVNLVDLAVSDKSLLTLGLVINSLAEPSKNKRKSQHVNYRNSVLTWLLKNSLGGNSKTIMLATVSPAADNYKETLSTLRYADSAKRIVNRAVVNEDVNSEVIDELQKEIRRLREKLASREQFKEDELQELKLQLEEKENLLRDLDISWEEKLKRIEVVTQEWQENLRKILNKQEVTFSNDFYIIQQSTTLIIHHIEAATTRIGSGPSQDIQMSGPEVESEHCVIKKTDAEEVFLIPGDNSKTSINGCVCEGETQLWHEDKIQIGTNVFTVHLPNRPKPGDMRTSVSSGSMINSSQKYSESSSQTCKGMKSSIRSQKTPYLEYITLPSDGRSNPEGIFCWDKDTNMKWLRDLLSTIDILAASSCCILQDRGDYWKSEVQKCSPIILCHSLTTPGEWAQLEEFLLHCTVTCGKRVIVLIGDLVEGRLEKTVREEWEQWKFSGCDLITVTPQTIQWVRTYKSSLPKSMTEKIETLKLILQGSKGQVSENPGKKKDDDISSHIECCLCGKIQSSGQAVIPSEVRNKYRLTLKSAGLFCCQKTGIQFQVTGPVVIDYNLECWSDYLEDIVETNFEAIGPLFNITTDQTGVVSAVYLPHYLCVKSFSKDLSLVRCAHFIDGNMALEKPIRVEPYYVIIENPTFSCLGPLLFGKKKKQIHGLVFIYFRIVCPGDPDYQEYKIHLYLLPATFHIEEALNTNKVESGFRRIGKPAQTCKLVYMKQNYLITGEPRADVHPKKLRINAMGSSCEFTEIIIRGEDVDISLNVEKEDDGEKVWHAKLTKGEIKEIALSSPDVRGPPSPSDHFVDIHREALIQRLSPVDPVLDYLLGQRLLTQEQYDTIRKKEPDQKKIRLLYKVMKTWGNRDKDKLYRALCRHNEPLIRDLEGC